MAQVTQNFTLIEATHRFGNKDSSVTSWNVIGPMARALPDYLSAAQTIKVAAANTTDTASGTGGRAVELIGLGSGWIDQKETVWLNGNTPVDTALQWVRVNRVRVLYAGSNDTNAGSIFIGYGNMSAGGLPASLLAQIDAGEGKTTQITMTVPASREAHIHNINFYTGKAGGGGNVLSSIRVRARERARGDEAWQVYWIADTIDVCEWNTGDVNAVVIQGPADIIMEANASAAGVRWSGSMVIEIHKDLQ